MSETMENILITGSIFSFSCVICLLVYAALIDKLMERVKKLEDAVKK